jgi:hypothetical protein
MEPIITLIYILSSFFGYYISADIWNQINFKTEMDKLKSKLDIITSQLNNIDSKID